MKMKNLGIGETGQTQNLYRSNINVCQPLAVTVISLFANSVEASVIFVCKLPGKISFPVELALLKSHIWYLD